MPRSMSNAAWISRQKSSSCATSTGFRPSTCRVAGRMRASASLFKAGTVAVAAKSEPRKRRRVVIGASGTSSESTEQHAVREQIDHQHGGPKGRLDARRETGRIHRRHQIMLDETAAVARLSRPRAQAVLEGRERANPAAVLDQDSPQGAGDVDGCHPPPAPREKAAQHDK